MTNSYLSGTYAPVRDELTCVDLEVTGTIPAHLDGRYLRIGPNPVLDPGDHYHWFLGDGMVHGVRLAEGRAQWYRNRWVRSGAVARALGEAPPAAPAESDFAANTNVLQHAGRTLALVEGGPPPYQLTDQLETVGPCDFGGTLRGGYSAHPHEDPETGELHAISYHWARGNRLDYSVAGTDGRIRHTSAIRVTGSPMVHDFALTQGYVIVYDLPVTFDIDRITRTMPRTQRLPARLALSLVIGRNPLPDPVIGAIARRGNRGGNSGNGPGAFPYTWNPSYPARIGLLPRDVPGAEVRWFDIDPCYIFHTLNAYEDGHEVVIDVVRHDRTFDTVLHGPQEGTPTLTRFTLDLNTGRAREHGLDQRAQEFPRYDERRTGRQHRYGYAVGMGAVERGDAVLKHDLTTGLTSERVLGTGRAASEFCFVATDAGSAEDDGLLMGYVHDRSSGLSDLVILDAGSLEDVAVVHLPARVPAGFHGNWAPTGPEAQGSPAAG
jgi:carotenoid cleavage dioxygenase